MKKFKLNNHTIEIALILIFTFLWNQSAYLGARLITGSWHHYDMTIPADEWFPFVPWTVVIYFGCYLFWAHNYYICAKQKDKKERDRYFCADAISKIVCFICFLAVPTTNVRPEITDTGVWGFLMKFLYFVDAPDNLFPSIHCLVSWFCWVGIRKRKDIAAHYRYLSLIFALAVCISTLTTRQHVLADVIGGVALAEICYFIAGFSKIRNVYSKIIKKLIKPFLKKKEL